MSTLCDFLLELFRGTVGLAEGTLGISGTRGISVIFALRELAFEVAFEGNLLGSSMPPPGISKPDRLGGKSDILVFSKSSSSS
jgi:hypothetical protein